MASTASARRARPAPSLGATVMPARTRCWPWMMTLSPAFSPSSTASRPSRAVPSLDPPLLDHVLVVDRRRRRRRPGRCATAACGDRPPPIGGFSSSMHHAHRLAVGQRVVLVGEHRAHDLAVGLGIDRDVEEVDACPSPCRGCRRPAAAARSAPSPALSPRLRASSSSRWVTGEQHPDRVSRSRRSRARRMSGPTRLPGETAARPIRPVIGDLISV